jgi:hypothetical protein
MNAGPSQDFFADLERELVTATNERRPRLRRARTRRLATMSTILVAIVAAGGGLAVAVTSSDDTDHGAPASSAPVTHAVTPVAPAAARQPGSYIVSVLNGTTVPGLARGVANRLTGAKQKLGNVTNAATQDRSSTVVEYAPGHRPEASAVASTIDVAPDAIRPLSAASRTVAGDKAAVVVVVGSDQNTSPHRHK